MTEELDKLEAAIEKKAKYLADYKSASSWDEENDLDEKLLNAARAYLTAQRQAPAKNPLEYFSKNIDGRKTIEVFESACNAIKKADEATVAGDAVKHEIWFNIFKCESMRLMREYEEAPNIRAALTNSVPVGAMNKIELALLDSRAVFAILKHDKPDDHPYNLLFENCDKALRELEPWVKEVE